MLRWTEVMGGKTKGQCADSGQVCGEDVGRKGGDEGGEGRSKEDDGGLDLHQRLRSDLKLKLSFVPYLSFR